MTYNTHWQASDLPRLFLSARGGSFSVGGVVLRSDALASALMYVMVSDDGHNFVAFPEKNHQSVNFWTRDTFYTFSER